jgi:glycosyltransferase involved in cell wall biosynthesis
VLTSLEDIAFMKISYLTNYDAQNVKSWSGSPYYMSQSLKQIASDFEYIGPLKETFYSKLVFRARQVSHKLIEGKRYIRYSDLNILKQLAHQANKQLEFSDSDFIFSPVTYTLPYLECKQPLFFWADSNFAGMIDYYPTYSNLCEASIKNSLEMEQIALDKCRLAFFASDWAAQNAVTHYQINKAKVKVVPYGANIDSQRTYTDIKTIVDNRSTHYCKLLFLGVNWQRKGGDVALAVSKKLNQLGLRTELNVVGCQPPADINLPEYVNCLGFISKATKDGRERLNQLLAEAHFLIVPSRAECYGVVFCEANSFGVPCLAAKTGGVTTIIREDLNGKIFDLDEGSDKYCSYILDKFTIYSRYKKLAMSAFEEYQSRLNWQVGARTVKKLIMEVM